jgi:hypothetical protein
MADPPKKRSIDAVDAPASQPPAKRTRYDRLSGFTVKGETDRIASDIQDFDDTIIVLVGPKEKRFSIHQEAICDKSKFFKAACSKSWIECNQKLVRLPEVEVEVFRQYCKWVYSGLIPVNPRPQDDKDGDNKVQSLKRDLSIQLYLLGDLLDDIQLRKMATQALFETLGQCVKLPAPSGLATIWSLTPSQSLFRKLLVNTVVTTVDRDDLARKITLFPPEFIQDVAVAALRKIATANWETGVGDVSRYLEPEELSVSTV